MKKDESIELGLRQKKNNKKIIIRTKKGGKTFRNIEKRRLCEGKHACNTHRLA